MYMSDWPPPGYVLLEDLDPCPKCGCWNLSMGPNGWFCDTCLILVRQKGEADEERS
jgi:hypothetical protein